MSEENKKTVHSDLNSAIRTANKIVDRIEDIEIDLSESEATGEFKTFEITYYFEK